MITKNQIINATGMGQQVPNHFRADYLSHTDPKLPYPKVAITDEALANNISIVECAGYSKPSAFVPHGRQDIYENLMVNEYNLKLFPSNTANFFGYSSPEHSASYFYVLGEVSFYPEPNNLYDKDAILVIFHPFDDNPEPRPSLLSANHGYDLGYIPKGLTPALHEGGLDGEALLLGFQFNSQNPVYYQPLIAIYWDQEHFTEVQSPCFQPPKRRNRFSDLQRKRKTPRRNFHLRKGLEDPIPVSPEKLPLLRDGDWHFSRTKYKEALESYDLSPKR